MTFAQPTQGKLFSKAVYNKHMTAYSLNDARSQLANLIADAMQGKTILIQGKGEKAELCASPQIVTRTHSVRLLSP